MFVSVVHVGDVGMVVDQWRVAMQVAVGVRDEHARRVRVIVVLIVHVHMIVLERLVRVHVRVPLAQEEDDSQAHRKHREPVARLQRLSQPENGDERTGERRRREVGSFSCRSDPAQRVRVQHHAHAVAQAAE